MTLDKCALPGRRSFALKGAVMIISDGGFVGWGELPWRRRGCRAGTAMAANGDWIDGGGTSCKIDQRAGRMFPGHCPHRIFWNFLIGFNDGSGGWRRG